MSVGRSSRSRNRIASPAKGGARRLTRTSYWYSLTAHHNSNRSPVCVCTSTPGCTSVHITGGEHPRQTAIWRWDSPRDERLPWGASWAPKRGWRIRLDPGRPGVASAPKNEGNPPITRPVSDQPARLCGVASHEGGESRIIREHILFPQPRQDRTAELALFSLVVPSPD